MMILKKPLFICLRERFLLLQPHFMLLAGRKSDANRSQESELDLNRRPTFAGEAIGETDQSYSLSLIIGIASGCVIRCVQNLADLRYLLPNRFLYSHLKGHVGCPATLAAAAKLQIN